MTPDVRLVVDAGMPTDPGQLIPDTGEFRRAMLATATTPDVRLVPDEVYLHLYACELLERMRERVGDAASGATWVAPFWPSALFEANDIAAHGAREIEGMFPVREIVWVERPIARVREEVMRVFGADRLDATRYVATLRQFAEGAR